VNTFYGKYRGSVEQNVDPLQMGRLQVSVPAVLGGGRLSWAMPSVPYAGPQVGFLAIPPVRANVWIEFEGGDPDYPIWSGCFWGAGELPLPTLPQIKFLKTDGIKLTLSDLPGAGGLTIEVGPPIVPTPLKVTLGASGIELSNSASSVKLSAVSVSVNNGALEIV
jgi:Type VI secretion system/phage-baseplate injector OB domain